MRVGVLLEGGHYRTSTSATRPARSPIASLEDFGAGRPLQFSQRDGTLDTSFNQYQFGFYWQDDIRVHRNFSLGVGLRNEMQSRIGDKLNLMPRVGFTLGTVGQPDDRGARRLRPLLRLVRVEPLRPDAARRRRVGSATC